MKALKFLVALVLLAATFAGGYIARATRHPATTATASRRILYYVDPMHPAYKSDKPGIAPDCGMALDRRDLLEVTGDAGSVLLEDPWHCRNPLIQLRRDGETERIEIERANSYRLEAENFSAAIRGQTDPLLGRDDALGQARAIEALYRAADRAEAISLT